MIYTRHLNLTLFKRWMWYHREKGAWSVCISVIWFAIRWCILCIIQHDIKNYLQYHNIKTIASHNMYCMSSNPVFVAAAWSYINLPVSQINTRGAGNAHSFQNTWIHSLWSYRYYITVRKQACPLNVLLFWATYTGTISRLLWDGVRQWIWHFCVSALNWRFGDYIEFLYMLFAHHMFCLAWVTLQAGYHLAFRDIWFAAKY